MLALHPTYLAARGDPKSYLDDLRKRMNEIGSVSPALPNREWQLLTEGLPESDDSPGAARTSGTG